MPPNVRKDHAGAIGLKWVGKDEVVRDCISITEISSMSPGGELSPQISVQTSRELGVAVVLP